MICDVGRDQIPPEILNKRGRLTPAEWVEVRRQPGSRPTIAFSGVAAQYAARLGVKHVSLSLSHTAEQAIAMVILED